MGARSHVSFVEADGVAVVVGVGEAAPLLMFWYLLTPRKLI